MPKFFLCSTYPIATVAAVALSAVFPNSERQQPTAPSVVQPSTIPQNDVGKGEVTSPPRVEDRSIAPPVQTSTPASRRRQRQPAPVQTPSPSPSNSQSPPPVQSPALSDSPSPSPVETPTSSPSNSPSPPPVQPPPSNDEAPPPAPVQTQSSPPAVLTPPESAGEVDENAANDDSESHRQPKPDNEDKENQKQQGGED